MKTFRLLAANTAAQMVGKVITAGSTLLITRIIADAQGLGRSGYNDFAIITAYAAYFYILADFGLNAVATKEMTEDESRLDRYMANLLSMRLVMAVILIMLGLAVLSFLPYSATVKLGCILMLGTIMGQAIFTNSNAVFQTKLRYVESVLASTAGAVISLVLVYLAFKAGLGLFGYLAAMLAGSVAMAMMSLLRLGHYVPLRLSVDTALWRHLWISALPLGITVVFNLAYFKSDAFILSIVNANSAWQLSANKDLYDVGLYAMAYKVFEVALVLPIYLVNTLYPLMVKQAQQGAGQLRSLFIKALWGLSAGSALVALAMWLCAPWLIEIVSGGNPQFAASGHILRWLSLTIPLFFVTNILLWTIMTMGKQRVLAFYYAMAAVINIGLNIWLIPHYGYVAAIATTAVTELVTLVLMAVQVWSLLGRQPLPLPSQSGQRNVGEMYD